MGFFEYLSNHPTLIVAVVSAIAVAIIFAIFKNPIKKLFAFSKKNKDNPLNVSAKNNADKENKNENNE